MKRSCKLENGDRKETWMQPKPRMIEMKCERPGYRWRFWKEKFAYDKKSRKFILTFTIRNPNGTMCKRYDVCFYGINAYLFLKLCVETLFFYYFKSNTN